jgi:prepilin-type N-terminal cleavage/methylation domain-containing protein
MYCQSNRTVSKKRFVSSPVNPLKQGFTLVELMVSLVILALLASAVSVSIRSYLIRSKQSIAKIEISISGRLHSIRNRLFGSRS